MSWTCYKSGDKVPGLDADKKFMLEEIQSAVYDIARKYGLAKVSLFGSYARGDAVSDSDIGLRIDKGRLRGLFQLSGLKLDLEERLGVKVDVLTTESLDGDFIDRIRAEEAVLYERQ